LYPRLRDDDDFGNDRSSAARLPAGSQSETVAGVSDPRVSAAHHGVVAGPHDFSALTGRFANACSACHVPHVQGVRNADQTGKQANLELYRIGGQRQVFQPDRYMPGPTSLICLSCHNGTVAESTIGTSHALLAGQREGFDVPDGFVFRDHPIGVPYPTDRKNYRLTSFVEAEGKIRLPDGRLECISCHDPHTALGVDKMLVMSNHRSALCLACHIK
jgi:predicted CXXCH cytochrome family protein